MVARHDHEQKADILKTSFFKSPYAKSPNAVSIAARPPSWFYGFEYKPLAPSWELAEGYHGGKINVEEHTKLFNTQLIGLDPRQAFLDLGENAILLCHEPPGQFCPSRIIGSHF